MNEKMFNFVLRFRDVDFSKVSLVDRVMFLQKQGELVGMDDVSIFVCIKNIL